MRGMRYLTYSGNNIISVRLPDGAKVFYAPDPIRGIARDAVPGAVADYIEAHGLYGAIPPTPFQPWKGASGGSEAGGAVPARQRPQTP